MSRPEILQLVALLSVPVIAGIVGALGILLQDWRARRDLAVRRRVAMEEATMRVAFATEWWKACQLIAADEETLTNARARAALLMAEASSLVGSVPAVAPMEQTRPMPQRLLLLYPLTRRSARVIRGFYYAVLVLPVVVIAGTLIDVATGSLAEYLWGDLILLSMTGAAALGLRFWAVRVEEFRKQRGVEEEIDDRPPPAAVSGPI
jgi:hypothetical protein